MPYCLSVLNGLGWLCCALKWAMVCFKCADGSELPASEFTLFAVSLLRPLCTFSAFMFRIRVIMRMHDHTKWYGSKVQTTSCCSDNLSCANLAMPPSQRSCLLCLALCIGYGSALPGLPATRDAWDRVLDQVWLKAKPRISFCLGESEAGVYSTVLDSFPKPLPTGPPGDAVCNNLAEVGRHLCGPKSLMEYYKVLFHCCMLKSSRYHRFSLCCICEA